jgi:hypothetical protein
MEWMRGWQMVWLARWEVKKLVMGKQERVFERHRLGTNSARAGLVATYQEASERNREKPARAIPGFARRGNERVAVVP